MRFMMMAIPEGYGSAAPDVAPSAEAVAKMMGTTSRCKRRESCSHWMDCFLLPREHVSLTWTASRR